MGYLSHLAKVSPHEYDGIHTIMLGNHGVDFFVTPAQAMAVDGIGISVIGGFIFFAAAEIIVRTLKGE